MDKGFLYIIIAFVFWLIAEYVTVWHAKINAWVALMPMILVQYLAIVLIFWFFIFKRKISYPYIVALTLVIMLVFEFLWQTSITLGNIFVLTAIWLVLVFGPLLIVKKIQ
ncbi:MAG: hypothetical protein PHD95_03685 [Candidatus ainarchaeum sp.]|nr:hypothetical protein [Candidatus ainarchaeum sp.]